MKPERVYGVDFSGAEKAGNKIWIAGGTISDTTLQLDVCQRAATLRGSSAKREQALAALRNFVLDQAPCIVGLDFPFGLPRALVKEKRWEDFAFRLGKQFPDADAFQIACTSETLASTCRPDKPGACRSELRRVTDCEAQTPFSPYNLRLYRQTYYGIRDVLVPLVSLDEARVLPMQSGEGASVWLIEICPASTLKHLGISRSYKDGKGKDYRSARQALLSEITQPLGIQVPDWITHEVRNDRDGDALDSIIAAATTFRALGGGIGNSNVDEPSSIEGYVYK